MQDMTIDDIMFAGYGDICPLGSFCLAGSDVPSNCLAGTYQDETGQSDCKPCVQGENFFLV